MREVENRRANYDPEFRSPESNLKNEIGMCSKTGNDKSIHIPAARTSAM